MHPFSTAKIARKLGGRKRRCSSFVKLYLLGQENGKMIYQNSHYVLPNMRDELVVDLGALSLTHKVVGVATPKWGLEIGVVESDDGCTNIDAEFIGAVLEDKKGGV
jgi:hypothetical protein